MRFKRIELSPANKKQYLFTLGRKDIELLWHEALLAHKHMPNTSEFKDAKRRLSSMSKGFAEALQIANQDGDDGDRLPLEDRQAYKDAKDNNPLIDITRLEFIDHRPCKTCKGDKWIHEEGKKPFECPECQGLGSKGRQVVFWDKDVQVESSVQDEGRTIKLFISERKPL